MCLDGEREYMDHQCVEMGRGSTWTINVFRWGEGVHGPSMCLDGEREYMDHQCV